MLGAHPCATKIFMTTDMWYKKIDFFDHIFPRVPKKNMPRIGRPRFARPSFASFIATTPTPETPAWPALQWNYTLGGFWIHHRGALRWAGWLAQIFFWHLPHHGISSKRAPYEHWGFPTGPKTYAKRSPKNMVFGDPWIFLVAHKNRDQWAFMYGAEIIFGSIRIQMTRIKENDRPISNVRCPSLRN